MLLGLYIFLCFVVGLLGRRTYLGFWANFIFSLFFTPIFPLIYILIALKNIEKWIFQHYINGIVNCRISWYWINIILFKITEFNCKRLRDTIFAEFWSGVILAVWIKQQILWWQQNFTKRPWPAMKLLWATEIQLA